jgi:hypothetical protein
VRRVGWWIQRTLNSWRGWVATGGDDVEQEWVEVGATQGWRGEDLYTYYTAHGFDRGEAYGENKITAITPVLGTTHRFSAFWDGTGTWYWVAIDGTAYGDWGNHLPYSNEYQIGFEATCGNDERTKVNRTYVSENQFRRATGSLAWTTPDNGNIMSLTAGGIGWCNQPVTFRYWLRSDIDTSVCA